MEVKYCYKCEETKLLVLFSKAKGNKDGHHGYCKECERAQKQIWYQANREISITRSKEYRANNPEWAKEADAKHHARYNWRERNPEKAKALGRKQAQNRRFRKHGLTKEEYDKILKSQGYVCAACDNPPVTSSVRPGANKYDDFVIDHDHVTGKVRGLVCTNCNVALGMIRDNPETARKLAAYLEANYSPMNCGLEVQTDVNSFPSGAEQLSTNSTNKGE